MAESVTCVRHAGRVAEQPRDLDLAAVGALFGDPTRVAMLVALADGRALPAGELARLAGVSPATATMHLRRLVDGGLIQVTVQGRHRYHRLAGPPGGSGAGGSRARRASGAGDLTTPTPRHDRAG